MLADGRKTGGYERHVCLANPDRFFTVGMAMDLSSDIQQPETERRLSEARSCAGCGTSLEGRRPQAKYCSDRCRVRTAREARVREWLDIRKRLDRLIGLGFRVNAM